MHLRFSVGDDKFIKRLVLSRDFVRSIRWRKRSGGYPAKVSRQVKRGRKKVLAPLETVSGGWWHAPSERVSSPDLKLRRLSGRSSPRGGPDVNPTDGITFQTSPLKQRFYQL